MILFDSDLLAEAERVLQNYHQAGLRIVTAESCTGGLIAACLTEVPGASEVLDCSIVAYSNVAKKNLLGVPDALLGKFGAVSAEVAEAMAEGALARAAAQIAVSTTGIAGPGGATPDKPVGLVYLGGARRGVPACHETHHFPGDRAAIRLATVRAAFALLRHLCPEGRA